MKIPDKRRWPVAIIISLAIVCTTYLIIIFRAEITGRIITRTQEMEKCRREVGFLAHQNEHLVRALKHMSEELDSKDQIIKDLELQLHFCRTFKNANTYLPVDLK
jgi:hypothetical protein